MLGVTEISAIVAASGVLIGVVYYILDMRNQRQVRQTDLIMRLYSRYGSEGFQKTYEKVYRRLKEVSSFHDYEEKYGWGEWVAVGTFFEGIGILLHRRLIDISLIDDLFTSPTKVAWETMKKSITEARKEFGQPEIFEWFEYLHNEMEKREQKLQLKA